MNRLLTNILPEHIKTHIMERNDKVVHVPSMLDGDSCTVRPVSAVSSVSVSNSIKFSVNYVERFARRRLKHTMNAVQAYTAALSNQIESITEEYDNVSVLFVKIKGIEKILGVLRPDVLVRSMDSMFSSLDILCRSMPGVLKMENVEDTYVAAAGIPLMEPEVWMVMVMTSSYVSMHVTCYCSVSLCFDLLAK